MFHRQGRSALCASDIEQRIPLSQPTISHHMAILTKAVDAKKIGLWRWYRRNETSLRDFARALKKICKPALGPRPQGRRSGGLLAHSYGHGHDTVADSSVPTNVAER
jgi:DNA-binding transcriptional ArsR family regulator